MFFRVLVRATVLRRGRAAGALVAITVSAAVATALLSLYGDSQSRLRADFRGYGANVIVAAPEGNALGEAALAAINSESGADPAFVAVPYSYVIARTSAGLRGTPVVVAGTDFARARALNTWWSAARWPAANSPRPEALVGERAAAVVGGDGEIDLWFGGKELAVTPVATLKTGGDEDSRIYIDLSALKTWTGVSPSVVELRIPGAPEQVKSTMERLQAAIPEAQVRPVRQMVEAETRVLGRTRAMLLWTTLAVIATSALCVFATLLSWVLDRRRDFAVMKAIGASEKLVAGFFAAEAAVVGLLGALLGFAIGLGVAEWIGSASFGVAVRPQFGLLPMIVAAGVALALVAASAPLGILRRIHPAAILRGE
ncbi:MAG TPA: ABC transporter permease [Terriglobales bacterium]|nr:ABC transporter permease [Terriglobales bacterium]